MIKIDYIVYISIIVLVLTLIVILYKYYKLKNTLTLAMQQIDTKKIMENYDTYITVLKYYVELSYEVIYYQDIASYVASGFLIDYEKNVEINRKFIDTFKDLVGVKLYNFYVNNIYGDEEHLLNNILMIFNNLLIENDLKTTMVKEVNDNGNE
jgi:hypothetical protein